MIKRNIIHNDGPCRCLITKLTVTDTMTLCNYIIWFSNSYSLPITRLLGTNKCIFYQHLFWNKLAAQAADADPFLWSSTNRQNPPFSKITITFEPLMGFWCPLGFRKFYDIVYFITGSSISNPLGVAAPEICGMKRLTYWLTEWINAEAVYRAAPGFARVC